MQQEITESCVVIDSKLLTQAVTYQNSRARVRRGQVAGCAVLRQKLDN